MWNLVSHPMGGLRLTCGPKEEEIIEWRKVITRCIIILTLQQIWLCWTNKEMRWLGQMAHICNVKKYKILVRKSKTRRLVWMYRRRRENIKLGFWRQDVNRWRVFSWHSRGQLQAFLAPFVCLKEWNYMTSWAAKNSSRYVPHHDRVVFIIITFCVCALSCKKFNRIRHSITFFYSMTLSVFQAVYRQTVELLTNWKGFRSSHVLVTIPSQHLPGGTEVYHEKTQPWWLLPMPRLKLDIDTPICLVYLHEYFFILFSNSINCGG